MLIWLLFFHIQDFCKKDFDDNPATSCILYDSAKCNGEELDYQMKNEEEISDFRNMTSWDVESIFVRSGCQLTVDTGIN